MNFWTATISALIAAFIAGLLVMVISRNKKKKDGIGNIDIDKSDLKNSKMETKVNTSVNQEGRTGNVDVNKSKVDGTSFKTNVSNNHK